MRIATSSARLAAVMRKASGMVAAFTAPRGCVISSMGPTYTGYATEGSARQAANAGRRAPPRSEVSHSPLS